MNGLKTILSWERHGYAPTLCICYGESALAHKDCRCGYHLAFHTCNHMSDLGRTWSRTHRLLEPQFTWSRGATDTRSGPRTCVAYQSLAPARDLCGVPCRELNYISFSCVLSGPWLFCGYMSYACTGSSCA